MGKTYYTFPDTDTIYSLSKEDLSVIRSGFRDKYIMDTADKFKSGTLTEEYKITVNSGRKKSINDY